MWVYWRPRGSPVSVPLPWWLAYPQPNQNSGYVPLAPGPIEVILALVVIAIYCYIGLALALSCIRLGIVHGLGALRKRSAFA